MSDLPNLAPKAAASLAKWHDMVARQDLSELDAIVHDDATFRSPMAYKPYRSGQAVMLLIRTVLTVFENFAYHRQLATPDGQSVVLEFSARVGDRQLKGIDLITFDADGKIIDFEVMIRPMSGLQALGEAMGAKVGAMLPPFKAAT